MKDIGNITFAVMVLEMNSVLTPSLQKKCLKVWIWTKNSIRLKKKYKKFLYVLALQPTDSLFRS